MSSRAKAILLLIVLLGALCFLAISVSADDQQISPATSHPVINFSPAEKAWLAEKYIVRTHIGTYVPYYDASADGVHGMAVDYLNTVARRAGFKVAYVAGHSWSEALNNIREHRSLDLLAAAYITPERKDFLSFSKVYLESPSVIFTREGSAFVDSMADLAGKTVAVERNYATQRWLAEGFPEVNYLVTETTDEALYALAAGEADAYIGNLTVGIFLTRALGLPNVQVAAPSPFARDEQAMAVRKDWSELAGIIDKTLATFTDEEHAAIRNRWLPPIRYEQGISGWDVLKWGSGISSLLLAFIAGLLIWNKRLSREISSRTAAEAQLAKSEEKYRMIVELSVDGILILKGDRFVDCNTAAVQMLGYASKAALVNTSLWDISPEYQSDGRLSTEKAVEMIAAALANGSRRFEWEHLRADGEALPVEVLLVAVSREGQPVLHVVLRDISVRRQVEEIREHLAEDLMRKNHELESFTYSVSHDLKSPLITIQGFAGILAQSLGESGDSDIRASIGFIESAARKMYDLLEDVLALSRIGRVIEADESLSLTEVACEALQLVEGRLAARPMTIDIADNLPRFVGDRTRLREVLQNLLENAIKYMGSQSEPRIEVGVSEVDGRRLCYVRDNGMGILPEYHEKVFGLFERLSNESEGTGVGLAQVRRIIELHGGRIWIESEGEEQGTTFWFTLPWE